MSQDSQDLHDRVTEILNAAETSSGSLLGDEAGDADGASGNLLETAAEANDLLESAEPDELLAAVGLDTLPDGSEPDSIPAAIARGDPEQVADLQRLLHLSNLADDDDEGALEGAVDALRSSIGDGEEATAESDAGDEGESDAEADSEGDQAADDEAEDDGLLETVLGSGDERGGDIGAEASAGDAGSDEDDADSEGGARETVEAAAETVGEASGLLESDEEEVDDEDDGGSDIGDQLRSAVESSLTDVGDDLEGLHERLQERSASSVGDEGDGEDDADAADEEDDGLFGSGLGSSDGGGGDGTRHSTMAPPPSKRADMKTTRHSTMPKRR
ncbi:hypothetical protein HTZ84_12225 [Haloterrigena sp. SYSU A558-1]|uniref:Uncharacterized protein n=1 Tax=Haloterrigena gelatinilytica TaxID=2741724 RepID=A0ABX2LFF1_9EURY|nr:hypothetical protein [Haloterrigena gelatinilytica]NUC73068.1 hypothetical protein [Haloterrigena gelatinilytica]